VVGKFCAADEGTDVGGCIGHGGGGADVVHTGDI